MSRLFRVIFFLAALCAASTSLHGQDGAKGGSSPAAAGSPEPLPSISPDATPIAVETAAPSPAEEAGPGTQASPAPDRIPAPEQETDTAAPEPAMGSTPAAAEGEMPQGLIEPPESNALIPDEIPPPETGVAPPPPPPKENPAEKERKERIRYQEVKLQAFKEKSIRDMKAKADAAHTDEDKRAALREYYKLLFTKMRAIDPSLTDKCNVMERAYIMRSSQYRVEPTIPLNPPPTPEPIKAN